VKIVIIGSGIGGLSAGIRLATTGHEVHIFEANEHPGGKIAQIQDNGYRFDIGPTLVTLPHLINELFLMAGENPEDYVDIVKIDSPFTYFFEDKSIIHAYHDVVKFAEEVENAGELSSRLKKYLHNAREKYDLTASIFLEKSIHQWKNLLTWKSLYALSNFWKLHLTKTMHGVNKKYFKSDKLIQLFDRYATYNGSDPYKAPGMLTMISHLEHNLGAYHIKNGVYSLSKQLFNLASIIGVNFYFNHEVREIMVSGGYASGIAISNDRDEEKTISADLVISNADVYKTYQELLPGKNIPKKLDKQELSNSALIFCWGMKKKFPQLSLHNVFFSKDYQDEFNSIFKKREPSPAPTVYVYISSKKEMNDAPEYGENWHIMINVPYDNQHDWAAIKEKTRRFIIKQINEALDDDIEPYIEREKILDPVDIEKNTRSYKGALYGPSSNSSFSAFLRHPNFSKTIKGLYFCGGSVHPGGGIPISILSGKIVADLIKGAK